MANLIYFISVLEEDDVILKVNTKNIDVLSFEASFSLSILGDKATIISKVSKDFSAIALPYHHRPIVLTLPALGKVRTTVLDFIKLQFPPNTNVRQYEPKPMFYKVGDDDSSSVNEREAQYGPKSKSLTASYLSTGFYGTNRTINNRENIEEFFGDRHDEKLNVGTFTVSIPRSHVQGAIEKPSWLQEAFGLENPKNHMMVTLIKSKTISHFKESLQNSQKTDALLFIHGYNVPFKDAMLRTAQLGFDIAFKGDLFSFIWPSYGNTTDYIADMTEAEYAAQALKEYIELIVSSKQLTSLNIIAHSMGNLTLTKALQKFNNEEKYPFPEMVHVILAAPDLDVDLFKADNLPWLPTGTKPNITLYASGFDIPLKVSAKLRKGYTRLGQGGKNLFVYEHIDSIDASNIKRHIFDFNHGYFASKTPLLYDIHLTLLGAKPDDRILTRKKKGGLAYWEFRNAN